jgi:hypothetical protein
MQPVRPETPRAAAAAGSRPTTGQAQRTGDSDAEAVKVAVVMRYFKPKPAKPNGKTDEKPEEPIRRILTRGTIWASTWRRASESSSAAARWASAIATWRRCG